MANGHFIWRQGARAWIGSDSGPELEHRKILLARACQQDREYFSSNLFELGGADWMFATLAFQSQASSLPRSIRLAGHEKSLRPDRPSLMKNVLVFSH
ncbi:hypothetical protein [Cerasicoccus frondis]|uniref:hypothetical protein n=1 Tax=Cerasicoccus frondis TaxID=490090 RepID=UPI002852BC16|nr:hypothetical protein [Cerasicoccus frondis]